MTPRPPREEWMAAAGMRMRIIRLRANLSQRALAKKAGIDVSTLCALERGVRWPNTDTMIKLSRALNVAGLAAKLLRGEP